MQYVFSLWLLVSYPFLYWMGNLVNAWRAKAHLSLVELIHAGGIRLSTASSACAIPVFKSSVFYDFGLTCMFTCNFEL